MISRRRRVALGVTGLGTALLASAFTTRPASRDFYLRTASVALTWTAGGLWSGPLHRGWIQSRDQRLRRPIITPVATGVAAFGFFSACAVIAERIPLLDRAIDDVLAFAEQGSTALNIATTLANGLGEEVFFRGALYSALPDDRAVVASTAIYAATTAATRNPALMVAAAAMGTLFSLQRRASNGLQAPALTHVTWSTLMVCLLPRLRRHRLRSASELRTRNAIHLPSQPH